MSDRLVVDVEALRSGGVNIEGTTRLALAICAELRSRVAALRGAGGGGEMGQKFDQGYKPGEEEALRFLDLLGKILGDAGGRTITTARVFADSGAEADAIVRTE
ncbi:hypothetical protein [Actinokineospora sp. NPDC004072]